MTMSNGGTLRAKVKGDRERLEVAPERVPREILNQLRSKNQKQRFGFDNLSLRILGNKIIIQLPARSNDEFISKLLTNIHRCLEALIKARGK